MKSAVLSGDIIAYTSLSDAEKIKLDNVLKEMLIFLSKGYNVFGRVLKGDYIECYIPKNEEVLRVALLVKTYIKNRIPSIINEKRLKNKRLKFFQTYGIRLAIGIGELSRLDIEKGVMDGEAIYMTGRLISGKETYDKERISVKNSIFIETYNKDINNEFAPLIGLLDKIVSEITSKQAEVLFYKLQNVPELKIAKLLNISQSAVNQHSTGAAWNAVEKAVLRFEHVIKQKVY